MFSYVHYFILGNVDAEIMIVCVCVCVRVCVRACVCLLACCTVVYYSTLCLRAAA